MTARNSADLSPLTRFMRRRVLPWPLRRLYLLGYNQGHADGRTDAQRRGDRMAAIRAADATLEANTPNTRESLAKALHAEIQENLELHRRLAERGPAS